MKFVNFLEMGNDDGIFPMHDSEPVFKKYKNRPASAITSQPRTGCTMMFSIPLCFMKILTIGWGIV